MKVFQLNLPIKCKHSTYIHWTIFCHTIFTYWVRLGCAILSFYSFIKTHAAPYILSRQFRFCLPITLLPRPFQHTLWKLQIGLTIPFERIFIDLYSFLHSISANFVLQWTGFLILVQGTYLFYSFSFQHKFGEWQIYPKMFAKELV